MITDLVNQIIVERVIRDVIRYSSYYNEML